MNQTRGQATLPETWEFDFARRVVARAARLGRFEREALMTFARYSPRDLPRLSQEAHEAVVPAWQDDGARVQQNQWFEDFAGVDDAHRHRSDANGVDADDSMFCVETNDQEMLAIESIEEGPKQTLGCLRIADSDRGVACQTLLHQHHPVARIRIGMLA